VFLLCCRNSRQNSRASAGQNGKHDVRISVDGGGDQMLVDVRISVDGGGDQMLVDVRISWMVGEIKYCLL
jgi:hypothetical protein